MSVKIVIDITENDSVIFVYMFSQDIMVHKFRLNKVAGNVTRDTFIKNACDAIRNSVFAIIKTIIKGGD